MTTLDFADVAHRVSHMPGAAAWPPWQGIPRTIRHQIGRPLVSASLLLPAAMAQPIPLSIVAYLLGYRTGHAVRGLLAAEDVPIVRGFGVWARRDCIHMADYQRLTARVREGLVGALADPAPARQSASPPGPEAPSA